MLRNRHGPREWLESVAFVDYAGETMSHLVDTSEMYLKAVYELQEEGVVPLRARLVERLEQSKPTVSETVARLERDGLLRVGDTRAISLTDEGRRQAVHVMRKHRLAERLLIDVLGMPWTDVHVEACRWEHVMSDAVESRLQTLLGRPASTRTAIRSPCRAPTTRAERPPPTPGSSP